MNGPGPIFDYIVRHGSKLSYADLREEAYEALDRSPLTQAEIADRLGVERTSVADAVTTAGRTYVRLQIQILEELTEYCIEPHLQVQFRLLRRDRSAA